MPFWTSFSQQAHFQFLYWPSTVIDIMKPWTDKGQMALVLALELFTVSAREVTLGMTSPPRVMSDNALTEEPMGKGTQQSNGCLAPRGRGSIAEQEQHRAFQGTCAQVEKNGRAELGLWAILWVCSHALPSLPFILLRLPGLPSPLSCVP